MMALRKNVILRSPCSERLEGRMALIPAASELDDRAPATAPRLLHRAPTAGSVLAMLAG